VFLRRPRSDVPAADRDFDLQDFRATLHRARVRRLDVELIQLQHFVSGVDRSVTGIVTLADVVEVYGQMASPFFMIGRIDQSLGRAGSLRDAQYKPPPGLDQEGEPGDASEHGSDRVGGEPFDVAGHALIAAVTGSPVQDEQGYARDHAHRQQLPAEGRRWLGSQQQDRGEHGGHERCGNPVASVAARMAPEGVICARPWAWPSF